MPEPRQRKSINPCTYLHEIGELLEPLRSGVPFRAPLLCTVSFLRVIDAYLASSSRTDKLPLIAFPPLVQSDEG